MLKKSFFCTIIMENLGRIECSVTTMQNWAIPRLTFQQMFRCNFNISKWYQICMHLALALIEDEFRNLLHILLRQGSKWGDIHASGASVIKAWGGGGGEVQGGRRCEPGRRWGDGEEIFNEKVEHDQEAEQRSSQEEDQLWGTGTACNWYRYTSTGTIYRFWCSQRNCSAWNYCWCVDSVSKCKYLWQDQYCLLAIEFNTSAENFSFAEWISFPASWSDLQGNGIA